MQVAAKTNTAEPFPPQKARRQTPSKPRNPPEATARLTTLTPHSAPPVQATATPGCKAPAFQRIRP